MEKEKRTYECECKLVQKIGEEYKTSRVKVNSSCYGSTIHDNRRNYIYPREYMYNVDEALLNCSLDTRHIIMHDYLMVSDKQWYLAFYSRTTYYRLKRIAVTEFLRCLGI